jgi:hypothetical protein
MPGIEVVDARHSPREWRVICPRPFVVVFHTWRGSIRLNGRTHAAAPGMAFCGNAEELFVARPEADRPGSFHVIEFEPAVFEEWLPEPKLHNDGPRWAATVPPISAPLTAKFRGFFQAFKPDASALELQAEAAELSESMGLELLAGGNARKPLDARRFGAPR